MHGTDTPTAAESDDGSMISSPLRRRKWPDFTCSRNHRGGHCRLAAHNVQGGGACHALQGRNNSQVLIGSRMTETATDGPTSCGFIVAKGFCLDGSCRLSVCSCPQTNNSLAPVELSESFPSACAAHHSLSPPTLIASPSLG
jgi:hypothetical protein